MRERNRYPAGVPCWVDSAQPDPRAAAAFYHELFGWNLVDSMPDGSAGHYFVGHLRGSRVAAVGSVPAGAPTSPTWTTYIAVDSANDACARVQAAGGQVLGPALDVGDAGRMAVCADPTGAVFAVWQAGAQIGAEVVNEPNTWNWSNLDSRDLTASQAFYGAVFGWESTAVDFGVGESYMLRRPGYADYLEEIDPGVRQRHRDAGAPEGFSDAIGWLQSFAGERSHWSVTFAVDDTDAIAERARDLGATITTPPFDTPYTRLAVITDPQGAVFTISTYRPPE